MEKCVNCGKEAKYEFHVLEVQTLPVRDLKGEHKVQALGEFRDYGVCDDCAGEYLEKIKDFRKSGLKSCLLFAGFLIAGIVLTILFWQGEGTIRLLGLAAIACGIMGIYGTAKSSSDKRSEYAKRTEKEALEQAAWEVLVKHAPKKSEDSDLTYIPVTPGTLGMKKGDLMACYDLLPEIAVKAHGMIHRSHGNQSPAKK